MTRLPRGINRIPIVVSTAAPTWAGLLFVLLWGNAPVFASGHPEITPIPITVATWKPGPQKVEFRRADGPQGSVNQPILLIATQPWKDEAAPPVVMPGAKASEPTRVQALTTLKISIGGKALPAWELQKFATGFVLTESTLRSNPKFDSGSVVADVEVTTTAENVQVSILGMPDLLLAGEAPSGPFTGFAEKAKNPEIRSYLQSMVTELKGDSAQAGRGYAALAKSANEQLARFARRSLRKASYHARPTPVSGNIMEHLRWGLYLEQCGLYSLAFQELNETRILAPWHRVAQIHAGECGDRLIQPFFRSLAYVAQSVEDPNRPDHSDWYCLFAVVKSRGGRTLKRGEVSEIKNQFLLMRSFVYGITNGAIRLQPTFLEADDEHGIQADLVGQKGWFDSVFCVVPGAAGDPSNFYSTVGGDDGPNGAALSVLAADSIWMDFLIAWYRQFTWAARVGESAPVWPDADRAIACGPQPGPARGFGYRAALYYHWPDQACLRPKIADLSSARDYVQLWRIERPVAVKDERPASGTPRHHVLDPWPQSANIGAVSHVADEPFINLHRLFPGAGWARARATTWVFSPKDQSVRMWLGQNDGLAAWVNGRCVHEGHYYSRGKYEDRNLVDTVASWAELKAGWNEVRVVVESWPAPLNKGWGFSVRFCTWDNRPISGLAYRYSAPEEGLAAEAAMPKVGEYFAWSRVQKNFLDMLPRLTDADLASFTGRAGLKVAGEVGLFDGYAAFVAPDMPPGPHVRALSSPWAVGKDRDVALNNVMDLAREACAAVPFSKNGKRHALLVFQPEAMDSFLLLLKEPSEAANTFNGLPPGDRLLGYVVVGQAPAQRPLFVLDADIGDVKDWPTDEEDLLSPLSPRFIANKDLRPVGPALPGAAVP